MGLSATNPRTSTSGTLAASGLEAHIQYHSMCDDASAVFTTLTTTRVPKERLGPAKPVKRKRNASLFGSVYNPRGHDVENAH